MATILIVDDQPTNREFLVTLLGYRGHRLMEAADGVEALAVTKAGHPDLVVADVLMPAMDGYEFVRQLRADPDVAAIPVIFYTAHYLEREARDLARACGVVHVLTKPSEPEEVLRTVEAALGHGGPPALPSPDPGFDREHLRAVTDKLARKVEELEATERELRQRTRELAEVDRHKDEFLAMLAHELRNPLAPVRNALEVMRQRGDDRRASTQWARCVIERQVRHMARLIDDLLDVARITRGTIEFRKERVDLATAVAHAVETVTPLVNARDHRLTVALPPEPVYLEADPDRLEQVLVNLLHNATKFTESGGRIWLTAEVASGGCQPPVLASGQPPGLASGGCQPPGEVVLRVRDTGIGMTPKMLARAFDLFAQADRSPDRAQGGLGIGLTMVRRLVEMHGGRISAHSNGPGQGSEFVARLPTLGQTAETTPAPAGGAPGPIPRGARILVVDDNRDSADSFAQMLGMAGYDVQVAYNGPEAVAAARAQQPEVVLLDIGLPGLDGYQVASRLRQMEGVQKAQIIAVTGYCGDEDRRRSREAGFDHHLGKPVEPEVLFRLLAGRETPARLHGGNR